MPAVGQGIRKITVVKRQSGLGVPATGAGGQILRRRTAVFSKPTDTFESDEIVSHHQSTGIVYGLTSGTGRIEGLLSPATYKLLFEAILEKVFVAGVAAAGVSLTTAGAGPTYTLTRAAGSWLTDGFKIGDVIRTSAAGNANNINKNLWIIGMTATVLTVVVVNASTLTAEGPIAGVTITVIGKKTLVPMTGHTNDYLTFEDWYADLAKSELYPDARVAQIQLGLPGSGNSTFAADLIALNRTRSGVQQMTSPAAETLTPLLQASNGLIYVNGVAQTVITGLTMNIANGAAHMGAVAGSNLSPDASRGRVRVSGQFTGLFSDDTIQAIYDGQSPVAIQSLFTGDKTPTSSFMSFVMGRIKITNDAPDDGEKGIVRTYPFTGEINTTGGAALAYDQTIISVQDSDA